MIKLYLGPGGTGKSYMINQFEEDEVIKVSPTNLSAKIINGKTIYNLTNSPLNKLCSKGIKFTKTVVVDEVFLFSKKEFSVLLECLNGQDLIMFGDNFQMNTVDGSYFYEAFSPQELSSIEVIHLDKYYRQQDQKLISIIEDYRKTKLSHQQDFNIITLEESIQLVINKGFTILTGTHKRQDTIQRKINSYSNGFFGSDGVKYRIGQQVCMISYNGAIIEKDKIIGHEQQVIDGQSFVVIELQKNGKQIPQHTSQCKYKFISGDVLTVNIVQGQTLEDGVCLDCKYFFSFGSYYTGITRVRSYDKIYIMSLHKDEFQCDLNNYFIQ